MQKVRLDPNQENQLQKNLQYFISKIDDSGGAIPFDEFMNDALYFQGIGYYVNGTKKFGLEGDFITAPEISSLFSECLANQCSQVLNKIKTAEILEFGAGSGSMTIDILKRLKELDCLPEKYLILELSPDLIERQQSQVMRHIPELSNLVVWIDSLPESSWQGVVLANEVLDAMPVNVFCRGSDTWRELYIGVEQGRLVEKWFDSRAHLKNELIKLEKEIGYFPEGYRSEINLRIGGWLKAISQFLSDGAIFLIDYGYSAREYYHPDRSGGTLICHIQQKAHADPLVFPGLQDITANVDFSSVANCGLNAGLSFSGYTTQANFLLNNGIHNLFETKYRNNNKNFVSNNQSLKQLILPSMMGERFKVIGFTKNLNEDLVGFQEGDLSAYL
tara:strand:+ start:17931 stop:19097 length:1167 start_codon:yes stop_codon:yes gene_type:complete